ncbi:amiloride-sensitive sodium channel domain-containing protein [Ditylenchus destructor]|uniref:Amiloride-sensitive sodium channel domain-containing protein n=1 Tax=Ditylenchus destructor TaxID=166010 RepID=A0AAD4MP57_9BILA|nr:amiloride-sensitive sodium channel domain-containing protein [Ditylenchus destructor]
MGFFDAIYSIVTNKHVRHVTFYSVLIIMAVLTIHDIFNLGDQYVNDNKKAEMEIVFNDSMTFPNMTFCMTKKQAWSHFKLDPNSSTADWDAAIQEGLNNYTEKESFLKRHWDFRMVMEAYQVIATLNSMERETTGQGAARSITGFRLSPRLGQSRLLIKVSRI